MKARLILNPASGNPAESAAQLVELLRHLQTQQIQAEAVVVQPEHRLHVIARSLGIPAGAGNLADAVALLRDGRRLKIDVGQVRHGRASRCFLEAGVIGLASSLYPSADDIQHGDLGKIAEFISTLVSAAPSEIRLRVDHDRKEIVTNAHLVIVANMPFMGGNFQIGPDVFFDDRYLDVFVYSDLGKRDLIGHALQSLATAPDARIQRFRAKTITIRTNPAMPVMADGVLLGEGSVTVTLQPQRLKVMAGPVGVAATTPAPAAVAPAAVAPAAVAPAAVAEETV